MKTISIYISFDLFPLPFRLISWIDKHKGRQQIDIFMNWYHCCWTLNAEHTKNNSYPVESINSLLNLKFIFKIIFNNNCCYVPVLGVLWTISAIQSNRNYAYCALVPFFSIIGPPNRFHFFFPFFFFGSPFFIAPFSFARHFESRKRWARRVKTLAGNDAHTPYHRNRIHPVDMY